MSVNLTRDAIAMVSEGKQDIKPVLQVYDIKLVMSQAANDRYRLLLSDGTHMQQSMLASQLNHYVKSGQLQKGSIVQMIEYICNTIQNRKIIIVINLEVVLDKFDIIGEPKLYVGASANGPAAPQVESVPAKSSPVLSRPATGNAQPYGVPYAAGHLGEGPNPGGSSLHPKAETGASVTNIANGKNYGISSHSNMANQNQTSNMHGRATPQSIYQPTPSYVNRGPIAKNEAPARIIPIAALNPYQGRWTIKARVTSKSELRRYNNPRGEGKVFSFDLLDSDGGEIRVTCFNLVADQFYDRINVGNVYLISKGSLKPAQKNFNHLNNEWEILLESTSTIEPCLEEDSSIPRQQFNFRPISEIESMENNSMVDIIGVVVSVHPSSTIMRKNGTETQKRTLQLKDMSGRSVELTIWGNFCNVEGQRLQEMCDSGMRPVLAVKAGRVSDFSGKSVGTISTSQLFIDPEFPEAQRLREWFNREGKNVATPSISRDNSMSGKTDVRKTVSQIKDEGLGRAEKPDWITVKAVVAFVKVDNFCYTACPLMVGDRQCNKKVTNNGDGRWHCDRCDQDIPECDYRYLLQFQIQDHTGITWVTAFQEAGEEIMGVSAKALYMLKHEEQDDVEFGKVIKTVLFNQYLFKLKVKEEIYSDEQRVKSTVVKAERLNFAAECNCLFGLIGRLSRDELQTNPATISHGGNSYEMNSASGYRSAVSGYGGNSLGGNTGSNTDGYNASLAYQSGFMGSGQGGGRPLNSFCNKCGGTDHNPMNCPGLRVAGAHTVGSFGNRLPGAGVDVGATGENRCYKCNQSGHWARDCPGPNATPIYGVPGGGGYGVRSNNYGGRY
ncbi:replication protein A 70 kDa DNA-binding subunit A-like [Nymphaea colorata]|nr:replication protein A 70 kDa DNA-binding subunit A-like [Nymphaea colorata]XP_031483993.1 replication protein A 70 kDa DNA-binding subunit A-like [Nymphaea colorata]